MSEATACRTPDRETGTNYRVIVKPTAQASLHLESSELPCLLVSASKLKASVKCIQVPYQDMSELVGFASRHVHEQVTSDNRYQSLLSDLIGHGQNSNSDAMSMGHFRKRLIQSKSPRVRLQRLEKCLDQKITMVRQQSTGGTA